MPLWVWLLVGTVIDKKYREWEIADLRPYHDLKVGRDWQFTIQATSCALNEQSCICTVYTLKQVRALQRVCCQYVSSFRPSRGRKHRVRRSERALCWGSGFFPVQSMSFTVRWSFGECRECPYFLRSIWSEAL